MAFTPSSTIYLCNVPFDNSNKHQVYFNDKTEQFNYFFKSKVKTFTEYLTVREILPDGNTQSSIKINASIDELRSSYCNYMMYQNANLSNKWIYAFVTKLIYINESTTKIVFETDVFQTYFFDVVIQPSFVKREHSENDVIGNNVVPESFNYQDYEYSHIISDSTLTEWVYLVITSERESLIGNTVKTPFNVKSGIYQGMYFYYFDIEGADSVQNLNTFLEKIIDEGKESVQSIILIPKFNIGNCEILEGLETTEGISVYGMLGKSTEPSSKEISFDLSSKTFSFGGYTPKNKKLYTNPFMNIIVTNHNGQEAEYNAEDFTSRNNIKFKYYGDISATPSVVLVPLNYKGLSEHFDSGLTIEGFPQCAFNTDMYKLWLSKNQYSLAGQTVGGMASVIGGIGTIIGSYGTGSAVGVGMIASGSGMIFNALNSNYQAKKEPNRQNTGNAKNNLLTAIGKNKFDFYCRRIKKNFAKTIDDYFTMFGYATNEVKQPNLNSRPYFNYVETVDINVVGAIPQDYLLKFKSIFNSGVTLWKSTAKMYDYSVDNSPK